MTQGLNSGLGGVLGVLGPLAQGVGGYRAGNFNAAAREVDATNAERDGAAEEAQIRDSARMAIGQQLAAQGANGFQMGTGSALDALTQSQINATLDALTARRAAAAKATTLRVSGAIEKAKGRNALLEGLTGAASALAGYSSDWAAARSGVTPMAGRGGGGRSSSSGGRFSPFKPAPDITTINNFRGPVG